MDILKRKDLFLKKVELRRVERKFRKNNNIPKGTDEPYIKYFRRTLGHFIAGNKLLDTSPNIRKFLLNVIKNNFVYYSEQYIDEYLKDIYRELSQFLDGKCRSINDCYISSIPNKDVEINNSSKELMIKFKELNHLPRNLTRTIEACMENEVKYTKSMEKLNEEIKKNPFNKHLEPRKRKIERDFNTRKIEISQELSEKLKSKKYLIFIDDFSGSGRTIIDYFKILEQYIEIDIGIIIICLHSMVNAEKKIEDYFDSSKFKEFYFFTNRENPESRKKYFSRRKDELRKEIRKMKTAERMVGNYLDSSKLEKFYFFTNRENLEFIKKYFSRRQDELKKEIRKKDELIKEIREFETKNFEQQFALGFQATESLVATYDSCPNNTFSSFWYSENDAWSPLFKRPRKQSNALDNLNVDRNSFVNEVKTGLKIRKVADKDISLIIILLCVKLKKNDNTTRVAIEIEDKFYYNIDTLQECLSNKYIKIIKNGDGLPSYSLTLKGKSKLKEYKMSYMTFEGLVKIASLSKAEDSISTDDISSYEIDLLNKSAE